MEVARYGASGADVSDGGTAAPSTTPNWCFACTSESFVLVEAIAVLEAAVKRGGEGAQAGAEVWFALRTLRFLGVPPAEHLCF